MLTESRCYTVGMGKGLTYRAAGVDIEAGNELVKRIASACRATHRPETLSHIGGFAALSELPAGYKHPVLVSGTDGVGTKLKLAIDHNRHETVGQDLVAMCANDVLACGAEPFLFLDYYATGKLEVEVAERVIKGIAAGCKLAGCALAGGETAEMPGFYQDGDYDLAGFCLGVVERQRIIDGSRIAIGDQLVGLASSGPHANGYSLIRRILESCAAGPEPAMLEALLAPTRIYAKAVLALLAEAQVRGMAHVTGGGFPENLPRMLADESAAILIRPGSWERPAIFNWLQEAGAIDEAEMLRTFNCGIGFVLCLPEAEADAAVRLLNEHGEQAAVIGEIVSSGTEPRAGELLCHPPHP